MVSRTPHEDGLRIQQAAFVDRFATLAASIPISNRIPLAKRLFSERFNASSFDIVAVALAFVVCCFLLRICLRPVRRQSAQNPITPLVL